MKNQLNQKKYNRICNACMITAVSIFLLTTSCFATASINGIRDNILQAVLALIIIALVYGTAKLILKSLYLQALFMGLAGLIVAYFALNPDSFFSLAQSLGKTLGL